MCAFDKRWTWSYDWEGPRGQEPKTGLKNRNAGTRKRHSPHLTLEQWSKHTLSCVGKVACGMLSEIAEDWPGTASTKK